MLGRKQAEINRLRNRVMELEAHVINLQGIAGKTEAERKALDDTNTQLVRDIREMDQLVYQMSQSMDAERLRSAVARAWAITEARMRAESRRIESVLIPEIRKVYGNENSRLPDGTTTQRQGKRETPRQLPYGKAEHSKD